jgi:hypothetical protein
MSSLNKITEKAAGRAGILAAAAFAAGGVTQIINSQRHAGNRVVEVAGYLVLSFFVVGLLAAAPTFIVLARRARSSAATRAAVAAAAGTAVLGLTSIASIVNGHDLGLFNVVAPITNAAWLVGSIVIAVSLKRAATADGRRDRTTPRLGRDDPARDRRRWSAQLRLLRRDRLPADQRSNRASRQRSAHLAIA